MPNPPYKARLLAIFLLLACLSATAQQPIGDERGTREMDPVISADGTELYFTRPDHARNQGTDNGSDIWIRARYADGNWGRALNPGSPINSFGNDRVLTISPDNNRLAVLRTGATNYLDLLERNGRTWRVLESWNLPGDAALRADLTFNPNSHRLIYSAAQPDGTLDLFTRTALGNQRWTDPEPLHRLNGAGNEQYPYLASDGRTLFFRRDGGQWFRQLDRGALPEAVNIPARFLQITAAVDADVTVAMTDDLGQDESLYDLTISETELVPQAELIRGSLGNPPAPGERTAEVPLSSGTELEVRPDALQRYAVYLRPGESTFPAATAPVLRRGKAAGSLAGRGEVPSPSQERYLAETLANRQQELDRLDRLRQQSYLGLEPNDDPERAALRDRLRSVNEMYGDTLPPTSSQSSATRARYAEDLSELERMKAKFRQQQEERLRARNGTPATAPAPVPTTRQLATYAPTYRSPQTYGVPRDTFAVRSTIQSGLYPDQRPPVYEREAWENSLYGDLPNQRQLTPQEVERLDAEYARKMAEVEALRAQLRQVRGEEPQDYRRQQPGYQQQESNYSTTKQRQWTAKSPEITTPNTYYREPAPARQPMGITFIPNTAYPNSTGYDALDALVRTVQLSATVVEIRVHTGLNLDPRSAQILSEERAASISNHLRDAGIAPANFRVIGYGNHQAGQLGERVEVIY